MGLFKATVGALGGVLGDQWKDFLTIPENLDQTAALFPAVSVGQNRGRGSNATGSRAVVSNGSKIVVPEGYGLLLFQDGGLTGFANEPGSYVWHSDDRDSRSLFAGNGLSEVVAEQSWERFKFGGRPASQQLALFVCLKDLPNNKFGTQSEVYWDDSYLNAQVGVIAHGTYSVRIVDPILFVKQWVPARYLQAQDVFDFTDRTNAAAQQLFSEVVGSLAAAFSQYANSPARSGRISGIQQDSVAFAASLSSVLEGAYQWMSVRGLAISSVNVMGIDYDAQTKELLRTVQRADALSGARSGLNLNASLAAGFQSAGETGGIDGILGLGITAGAIGLPRIAQETGAASGSAVGEASSALVMRLESLKRAFEAGLIAEDEYKSARTKALGLS